LDQLCPGADYSEAERRAPRNCRTLRVLSFLIWHFMVLAAIVLFCLAVSLGAYLLILGVRHRRGSRTLAAVHAGIAIGGLGVLGMRVFRGPTRILYNDAVMIFVLALAGGLVLLAVRLGDTDRRAPPSTIGVGLHAAMALLGLALLVWGYMRY
jgi:hypothetical protein